MDISPVPPKFIYVDICHVRIMTYSLVDSLSFIDLQDYRYRTINRCINGYHTEESLMDVVANIALVVDSEKGLFRVTAVA